MEAFLSGNGDVLLDYEDDAIASQRKGAPDRLRRPRPDDPDPEPDRGLTKSTHKAAAQAFVNYLALGGGPGAMGEGGLPARHRVCGLAAGVSFPTPSDLFTINSARWVDAGREDVLRPPDGDRRQDRDSLGVSTIEPARIATGGRTVSTDSHVAFSSEYTTRAMRRARFPRSRGAGARTPIRRGPLRSVGRGCCERARGRSHLPEPARADPDRGRRLSGVPRRMGPFWSAVTRPGIWAALKLTFVSAVIVVVVNTFAGTAIAWVLVRDNFPARSSSELSSTCHSPCRRSSPA